MIGYFCKYTPLELLTACGGTPVLLHAEAEDFETAESLTHANLCCHAKAMLQSGLPERELLLMDCCDSLRKVGDVLQAGSSHSFLHLMDLPHDRNQCARQRLREQLMELAQAYSAHTGVSFQKEVFLKACRAAALPPQREPFLAVLGARVPPSVLDTIRRRLPMPVADLTCSGNRDLEMPPEGAEALSFEDLMDWYANALLGQTPCMRMADLAGRRRLTEHPLLRGILYNTVKFCDYYGFEYAQLKKTASVPILKIETDYMPVPAGQLSTRLEAFSETLGLHRPLGETNMNTHAIPAGLYAGIDSGSTTTNMVVMNEKQEILASAIVRTGAKAQNGAAAALQAVCGKLSIEPENFAAIVATGYGRDNIPFATGTKTEITCHARGAFFLQPATRTIVDIGGQDSKVICLDDTGAVTNFIMNDKCAAGTGRFLEMMARTLELSLEDMSRRGLSWKQDLTISSMCTVFAESEVISLIADNHSDSDIIHGLNKSIAAKTASMVTRAKGTAPFMMTGGVARNQGVVRELEGRLGAALYIAPDPDLCGAIGAALFAMEEPPASQT